ncbi:alpha/beta fold hydrolase [Planctomonas psychrotolerans]|uniref:alpha/beta fold hydrolase n=1 Tax=Planctomonas psychrotolerans TaxID=2528712 RepID=UPI0012384C2C|nr:alpha/beta hydrolase [Planctomonas psychrotolerans]
MLPAASAPESRAVYSTDGLQIATYEFGDPGAPTVLAVHGFASTALANWHSTGWTRDLTRAGYRVIAIDQRGHGESDKPHSPDAYSMAILASDVLQVLDAYLLDEVRYVGYSLGARVGWRIAHIAPHRISRAVLGGIPDGDPLKRFSVEEAKAHLRDGAEVGDRLTGAFLTMARSLPSNDLEALVALVEGMRDGPQPSAANAPTQPVLFATGSEDRILEASRDLADATPTGTFFEIPGRNHFNAPTSRDFRTAAIDFFRSEA